MYQKKIPNCFLFWEKGGGNCRKTEQMIEYCISAISFQKKDKIYAFQQPVLNHEYYNNRY